jgi:hypothetical protein
MQRNESKFAFISPRKSQYPEMGEFAAKGPTAEKTQIDRSIARRVIPLA